MSPAILPLLQAHRQKVRLEVFPLVEYKVGSMLASIRWLEKRETWLMCSGDLNGVKAERPN